MFEKSGLLVLPGGVFSERLDGSLWEIQNLETMMESPNFSQLEQDVELCALTSKFLKQNHVRFTNKRTVGVEE